MEIKFPSLEECEQYALTAEEINLFCDEILKCVFDNANERTVFFSSFHPDICVVLSLKQPVYPVFFLTEGGMNSSYTDKRYFKVGHSDLRCNSLYEAVKFAKQNDLMGIVTDARPLVEAPHLINTVKEAGLLLFTYGGINNDSTAVRLQKRHGVDAVIVDSVARIRQSLIAVD